MIFGTKKRPVEDQGRDMNYPLKKLERVVFASPNYPFEEANREEEEWRET